MSFISNSILFSKKLHTLIEEDPFVICDIGAMGGLVEPWSSLYKINPNIIKIYAFEPNKDEFNLLTKNPKKNITIFPFAVWKSSGEVSIHIVKSQSSSSIHPPNHELIKDFDNRYNNDREIEKIEKIPTKTLDEILQDRNYEVDFIKIDTQGSEYEIIEGGLKTLQNCFGCTLESWTVEIHKEQHLAFDVMRFMHQHGFLFFDFQIGASWGRVFKNKKRLKVNRQIVGLDFLYLKDHKEFFRTKPTLTKVIKAVAIADVWGFSEYAIQLIEKYEEMHSSVELEELKSEIIKKRSKGLIKNPHINKMLDQFKSKVLKSDPSFPNIH